MSLFEIRAAVAVESVEAVDDLLIEVGDERWSLYEDVIARRAWIVGVFESEVAARASWNSLAPMLNETGEAVVRPLDVIDWRESYKLHFKPWKIDRLHWVPVWERETYALPPGDEVVWLDPGMAFGTGNHETTRLCVERLVAFDARRRASTRVIDAGCGSGILAISAAKLGFASVAGFDNDPEAVRIARENAAINDVPDRVEFFVGDLTSGFSGRRADFLVANILADVLRRFSVDLVGAVAPGGVLVLSGILATELDAVRATFATASPSASIDTRTLGEWADVQLRMP
ncbi:MAG TPA: 50S ribosomal protein L11 methyltransferase [Opitutaceae bacterium]